MADYVDNKTFYVAMTEYKKLCHEAEQVGDEYPVVSEYIAECFWKIASGLSGKPNFVNYSYKDEMIMDGVENCLKYCKNFNPEKSKNPFSYFTQIIYFAFLRRIEKEKKQAYLKYKYTEVSGIAGQLAHFDDSESQKMLDIYLKNYDEVNSYEERVNKRNEKKRKAKSTLEGFMDD